MSQLEHHAASILIDRPAATVIDYLADPAKLGEWAFENACVNATGLASGTSRFDCSPVFARVRADKETGVVHYLVGGEPNALAPRIMTKVLAGALLDIDPDRCGLTLLAWRSAAMESYRWRQLRAAHELEVCLIKARIEASASV